MEVLSAVLLVAFATFGAIAFARELCFYIFKGRQKESILFISPVNKDCRDAEMLLRGAAARVKWVSRGNNDCVICLDCDMDDKTREVCKRICKDEKTVRLMEKNEFIEMLKGL